jgi:hypothetical protein
MFREDAVTTAHKNQQDIVQSPTYAVMIRYESGAQPPLGQTGLNRLRVTWGRVLNHTGYRNL